MLKFHYISQQNLKYLWVRVMVGQEDFRDYEGRFIINHAFEVSEL